MRQTILGIFALTLCMSEISNANKCIDLFRNDSKIQITLLQSFDTWDATANLKLSSENAQLKIVQGTKEIQIKPRLWAEVDVVQVQFAEGFAADFQFAVGRLDSKSEPFPIYRISVQVAEVVNKVSTPGVDYPMSSMFSNEPQSKQYLRASITNFVEKNLDDLGKYLLREKKLILRYQLLEKGQIVIDLYPTKPDNQTEINNALNAILSVIRRSAP